LKAKVSVVAGLVPATPMCRARTACRVKGSRPGEECPPGAGIIQNPVIKAG
jgi:hypothetical protein